MDPLMTAWVFFIGCIIGVIIGVLLSYRSVVTPLQHTIEHLTAQDKMYHEKMKYYPYNPERFRFLGGPVDGIQFEDDSIVFVRFKEGNDTCSKDQEKIKDLVENGKVQWYEFITE